MPTLDAPAGGLAISKDALAKQLSKSARFKAWGSNTTTPLSESQALAIVHFDADTFPLDESGRRKTEYSEAEIKGARPFALINADPVAGYRISQIGSFNASGEAGMLHIHLEKEIPQDLLTEPEILNRRWDNDLAVIAHELMELKDTTDGMLQIDGSISVKGPWFVYACDHPGQGNFGFAVLTVTWGLGLGGGG